MPSRFMDCKDIVWVVDGVLAETGITLLSGDPGAGKTSLALQLAHCVMVGIPFMKQHVNKGKVLFVCQDESPEYVKDKIAHMLPMCPSLKDLEYHGEYFSPVIPQRVDSLVEASNGYQILVIDSLSAIDPGGENSVESIQDAMRTLRNIARQNRLAILLIHHLRKPKGDDFETTESRIRGSSAIAGSCDQMLQLYKQSGCRVLQTHSAKFRGDRTFNKLIMNFSDRNLTFSLKEIIKKRDD